ncbi:hypothetical protein [Granulicella sp. dw_53]|uniref:hypothetical protein n=1 Tax=Granulicella sp. dw_53 TaxID=2719792 RepID=UPI001BD35B7D|nr:hypothetical protein [Granulicella sp. dw_53]
MKAATWDDLTSSVCVGDSIRYWAPKRGYRNATFNIVAINGNRLDLTTKEGKPVEVHRKDFGKVAVQFDDLLQGTISRQELTKTSGRTAYILSLIRELNERLKRPHPKLGDLLSANSRVFLKSEYGPVSNEWPAVSFSVEGYARKLAEIFDTKEDWVLFAGTDDHDLTPPEFRKKLLCVVRIRSGPPVDSGVLVDPGRLNYFQQGDPKKFAYSLQATAAWKLATLPAARDLLKEKYGVIGRGQARKSYLILSPTEIDRLKDLPVARIALSVLPLDEFHLAEVIDSLEDQFDRLLGLLTRRAQLGGTAVSRNAPIRIVKLTKQDLREMWAEQGGLCRLCNAAIPRSTRNFLLQVSADRTDSKVETYSRANTQLTHLGCNYGKNSADAEQFADWLRIVRVANSLNHDDD